MESCNYSALVAGIPEKKLKEPCSNDVLLKISRNFTRWRGAAPYLELDDAAVEAVDKGNRDEEGKRYVILCRWKEILGFVATNEKLIRGFMAAGRADLAGDVASELRESSLRCKHESVVPVRCTRLESELLCL